MIDQDTRDLITNWAADQTASSAAPSLTAAASPAAPAAAPAQTGMLGSTPDAPAAATPAPTTPASTWSGVMAPAATPSAAPASLANIGTPAPGPAPAPAARVSAAAPAAPSATPATTPSAAPSADVASWYRAELGRDGDAAGISYWQNALNNGADPQKLYNDFTLAAKNNSEAVTPTSWSAANSYTGPVSKDTSTPVDDWGRNVLGRELTPGEKAMWGTRFNTAGANGGPAAVQQVYKDFIAANVGSVKGNPSLAEASQIAPGFNTAPAIATGPTMIDPGALAHRTINQPTETVNGQLQTIVAQDSPLLQQARAQAMTAANDRGMLNSSLAASAGEDAVLKSALQVATPDAAAYNHASDYNVAADNQATMYNATTANSYSQQQIATQAAKDAATAQVNAAKDAAAAQAAVNTATQNATLNSQMTIADMQAATAKYQTDTTSATSKYNTDAQYKQQAENNKKTLVNNIITSTEMSPDRKAAMLESLGEGTSAKKNADGTITAGTGMAGAVYVIDSTAPDLNFSGVPDHG